MVRYRVCASTSSFTLRLLRWMIICIILRHVGLGVHIVRVASTEVVLLLKFGILLILKIRLMVPGVLWVRLRRRPIMRLVMWHRPRCKLWYRLSRVAWHVLR